MKIDFLILSLLVLSGGSSSAATAYGEVSI